MANTQLPSEISSFRKRLIATFSAEALISFCFDYFHSVYEDFAPGMTKRHMVQILLDYCVRRAYVPKLLDMLEHERPGIVEDREILINAFMRASQLYLLPSTEISRDTKYFKPNTGVRL